MPRLTGLQTTIAKSGSSGTWAAGLVINNVTRWTSEITTQEVDGTSKQDGGYYFPVYGVKSCRGTVEMNADAAVGLLSTLTASNGYQPDYTTSAAMITLSLYDTTTDSRISGLAKVFTTSIDGAVYTEATEMVRVTFQYVMQGKFYVVSPT
jgi:hypothetical protein